LTHRHWYQELPGGDRIDFAQNRPVWLVTVSGYGQSSGSELHAGSATRRRSVVIDAATGDQMVAYMFS
jgi:hypothetical protein